jgi:hypothetical protein
VNLVVVLIKGGVFPYGRHTEQDQSMMEDSITPLEESGGGQRIGMRSLSKVEYVPMGDTHTARPIHDGGLHHPTGRVRRWTERIIKGGVCSNGIHTEQDQSMMEDSITPLKE